MSQLVTTTRPPGVTYAISDTGPLVSAFQSDSFGVLTKIFPMVVVPIACFAELEASGWQEHLRENSSRLSIIELTAVEENDVQAYAEQVAQHPGTRDRQPGAHLGEAQAIVLALRPEHSNDLLLVDEMAARDIARQAGLKLSGFPGALLLATHAGLISPEDLKLRLEVCRQQGTHYGTAFIQQVYELAQKAGSSS